MLMFGALSAAFPGEEAQEGRHHHLITANMIFPLFKDFGCGSGNMQVPNLLKGKDGKGKFVIDIGLDKGAETFAAVESGFTVFSFEPRKDSISEVTKRLERAGMSFEHIQDFNPKNSLVEKTTDSRSLSANVD